MNSIMHPNIVRYYDSFEEDNHIHFIYEQPETNLTDYLEKLEEEDEQLPTEEKWKIFIQIALGIQYI